MAVTLASPADFAAILALQAQNHVRYLPEDARGDGFLTTYLETPKLKTLWRQQGLFVAKSGMELVGYAGAEPWDLSGENEFHQRVTQLFPLLCGERAIDARNSLLYGPVCVAASFRGQNLLADLVGAVQARFQSRFEFILTFIDYRNARSLAAHGRKLGFQIVSQLPYDDTRYHVLALPL